MNILTDRAPLNHQQHRLNCNICDYEINPNHPPQLFPFTCNVRQFKDEKFRVWRCPTCQTVHCLEKVDLDRYYRQYPVRQADLTSELRTCYQVIHDRLVKHHFSPAASLLDYGCANGLVIQYFKELGFPHCHGYDPYGEPNRFGNLAILDHAPFDYILTQDVLEHVEDPRETLSRFNQLLAPGGYILIGIPNVENLNLEQPQISDHYNEIHVPYHLHLYTRQSLESLGREQGWEVVDFFDRSYHDTRRFSVNTRSWNAYQRAMDGTIDAVYEPINLGRAVRSPEVVFYALFGYWLSLKTGMAVLFRNSGG
jgi:SAM-dependent methyltransferase